MNLIALMPVRTKIQEMQWLEGLKEFRHYIMTNQIVFSLEVFSKPFYA